MAQKANQNLTRVSPGVYRNATGGTVQTPKGMLSTPPNKKDKKKEKAPKYMSLKDAGARQFDQTAQQDYDVGDYAGRQFGNVKAAYDDDFSFGDLPPRAVANEAERGRIEQEMLGRYSRQFEPRFKRELDEFEQTAYNKGWQPGNPSYDAQKKLLLEDHDRQRREYESQAIGEGGTEYERSFNLADRSRGTARDEYMIERDRPFQEWQAVRGAQFESPMWDMYGQDQAQQFAAAEKDKEYKRQQQLMAAAKAGSGGGGGGGGGGGSTGPYGFASHPEYWAFQDNREKEKQQWDWANNPAYRPASKPKGPSTGAQIAGSILGGISQGVGAGAGGWISKQFGV